LYYWRRRTSPATLPAKTGSKGSIAVTTLLSISPTLLAITDDVVDVVSVSIWSHLLTIGGFLLAIFALARIVSEKRQPGNTIAWGLVIILIPYIGVPLYLLFGGRKIKRLAGRKSRVSPQLANAPSARQSTLDSPVAQATTSNGANPPMGGNELEFITNGEEAFAQLASMIKAARHSIHITTFILGREEVGRAIITLLADKAREGVKVRLLVDGLGSFLAGRKFADPLREAGGEVVKFMPVAPLNTRASANLRNHRKIAVFDHCQAIIGGRNLAKEYLGPTPWDQRFTDFGAVIKGPAVGLITEVFIADWSFATGCDIETLRNEIGEPCPSPTGNAELQVIAAGPDVEGDPLYDGIVSMIQEAKESIWIITPYFIPDEVLQRSLLVKARAGKDVTLIIPARSNHRVTDYARRQYLRELHQAGAKIMLYQPNMLHAKAMIVDSNMALFGSANFDHRSLFVNFEIGVATYSASEARAMRSWAESLIESCSIYTPAPKRPFQFFRDLAEDLSRLLAPLL
jgi:cardiolipin synthase